MWASPIDRDALCLGAKDDAGIGEGLQEPCRRARASLVALGRSKGLTLRVQFKDSVNFELTSRNAFCLPVIGFRGSKNATTISYIPGEAPAGILVFKRVYLSGERPGRLTATGLIFGLSVVTSSMAPPGISITANTVKDLSIGS